MPLKHKDVKSALVNKLGFVPSESRSDDHLWFELKLPGLPTIATKLSHSRSDIGRNLEGKMARQCRVRKKHFRAAVVCTLSADEYRALVRTDPYPSWDVRF